MKDRLRTLTLIVLALAALWSAGCSAQAAANSTTSTSIPSPSTTASPTPTLATPTDTVTFIPTDTSTPNPTGTVRATPFPLVPVTVLPLPAHRTAQTPARPIAGVRVITFADNGKVIDLNVGERFTLALGPNAVWNPTPSDLKVVQPVAGAPGVYEAIAPGTVTISLSIAPACRSARPPCLLPNELFEVTLVVS
jgi:hypothetical protein